MTDETTALCETIAVYEDDGKVYEIDHLGIGYPETQWGEFAVYCDSVHVASFSVDYMDLPETDELVRRAKRAVAESTDG